MGNKTIPDQLIKYMLIVFLTVLLLYWGSTLFIPLFFGLLTAIIMFPVCHWLERRHWPRSAAIALCLILITLLFAGLFAVLVWQINQLKSDLPQITEKFKMQLPEWQQWLQTQFGISLATQQSWWENALMKMGNNVTASLSGIAHTLFILFLSPVFMALFLFHRGTFVHALQLLVGQENLIHLESILRKTIFTYFNFIKGMVMVYLLVGVLNTLGLWALGVKHALLFGMLCAIMTIIPYVGIIVSALLPITMAWLSTNNIWVPLGVIAVFSLVQYLEANIIFPTIVGTQLNVSTWATLVAILAGGIIWGISGMILFIPFVAILKIITDELPNWKALNVVLSRN